MGWWVCADTLTLEGSEVMQFADTIDPGVDCQRCHAARRGELPVRVLLLADSLGNGGMERQLSLLAAGLPSDWEVRVWAMGGGAFEAGLRDGGIAVTVRERRFSLDPLPAMTLWPALRSWRPDVVHAWSWMSALAAAPLCRALNIPLVNGMIRRGNVDPDYTRLRRLGMAWATLIVANTHAGLRAWGVSPVKGRVVHNGFAESRLAGVKERFKWNGDAFTVVMTGRMAPEKDFDLLIEVARRLSHHSGGWQFVLVGEGPDRLRLQRAARDLVDAGIVAFLQPGLEVLDVVRQADVGVLMSNPKLHYEGISNSIMEYMALGLPVVCSHGGGNPELVLEGVTGVIVPPGDPGRLMERLAYLRDHGDERAAMGAAGRARVLTDFSVSTMVDRMLEVYAEAMAVTRARRREPCRPRSRDRAGSTPAN